MSLTTTLLLTLLVGLGLTALLAAAQAYDQRRWRQELVAFQLSLPQQVTVDDVARWLAAVAATTHPPRWSLVPLWPVALEVRATARGISHYLLIDASSRGALLANLQANLPGARLESAPDYLATPLPCTVARAYTATSRSRPLAIDRAPAVSASLLAALQPLYGAEQLTLQLIMTSAGTPTPRPVGHTGGVAVPWWLEGQAPADADALRAERLKQREPLLAAVLRLGATADNQPRAAQLLTRAGAMLPGLNAPG
ncbi:MAG: type IV secretory system conjugative DNA transfer family protein, partial [Ktedonobacterales bacterium]|nr:type IV secretory system conjugative DNA transfer family protein [Ktedonobacterales bacterium]